MGDYDDAVVFVNQLFEHMADLARTIVSAVEDGKVGIGEGVQIGLKALATTQDVITLACDASVQLRAKIPYALEHGHWVLDEGA